MTPRRVGRALALAILALACAHGLVLFFLHVLGHDSVKGLVPLFHLDREANVPTLFSSTLLLAASVGFYLLHRVQASLRRGERHWALLAAIFVFLAFDESAVIHERLIFPLQDALGTSGIFYFAWVIPYGIGAFLLGLYLLPRILRLSGEIRRLFLLSAGLYLLGALGFELLESAHAERFGVQTVTFDLLSTVEEILEMAGLATLLYAQLLLLTREVGELRLQLTE